LLKRQAGRGRRRDRERERKEREREILRAISISHSLKCKPQNKDRLLLVAFIKSL
jgi:hypothetical protein